MKDYQLAAKSWGADIELRVAQNEAVIADDFKAGKCDAVSITGMRGRQFNGFTGSLDAIGAITDLKLAVKIMQGLASPTFAKYMVNGQYEVAGVIPVGDAYLLVNDRSINTVAKAAGKKLQCSIMTKLKNYGAANWCAGRECRCHQLWCQIQ